MEPAVLTAPGRRQRPEPPAAVDVIIVGGGPAGSSCARRLGRGGACVLVVDAARFPRDKVCAGWITPQVIQHLELNTAEYAAHCTFQPLRGFRVGRVGEDAALGVDYPATVSAAIRRCEFDAWLLSRSGAAVSQRTPVSSLRRDGDGWVVNERWTAPIVVGAGGYSCPVARVLNAATAASMPLVVAREAEFVLDPESSTRCSVQGPVAELFFTGDLAGYGWCVRKGEVMNVGLGRLDRRLTRNEVEEFSAFVGRARRFAVPPLTSWRGHAYVVGVPPGRRRTGDGLMLIGDAAGLASEKSGEGIGPAVESGLMAADAILESSGRAEALSRYDRSIDRRWPPAGALSQISGMIPATLTRSIARRLLRSPRFVRRVVIDRWFLHA
jgi:flavin-dependent dehydrogenase